MFVKAISAHDLYEENKNFVYSYCYGVLWNHEEAEDITSQTFFTALKNLIKQNHNYGSR